MAEPALLDREIIDEMAELIGAGTVATLFEAFAGDLQAALDALRNGLSEAPGAARSDSLRRQAHSLKSAAGQMGATALGEAAARLEREAADSGDVAQAGETLLGCGTATLEAISGYLRQAP